MNIPNIRLLNQQLLNPLFREPKELVSWMGAMQAQNYSMVKWAVGMRLKSATIQILLRKDMIWTSRMKCIRKHMTCWRRFFVERKA